MQAHIYRFPVSIVLFQKPPSQKMNRSCTAHALLQCTYEDCTWHIYDSSQKNAILLWLQSIGVSSNFSAAQGREIEMHDLEERRTRSDVSCVAQSGVVSA
jgi:hypothetical protein